MNNMQIILSNSIFLMQQGILEGIPGTQITWTDDEGEHVGMMPEQIHTFDEWKRLGYIVQKGQHAVAKFQIWMPKKGKKKDDEEPQDEQQKAAGFYKKTASFFKAAQVAPIAKGGRK